MRHGPKLATKLELQPKPLINYFNPVNGAETYGSMFVWTDRGRPEIVGAIWSRRYGDQRSVIHSFHSLSLQPLTAVRKEKTFWSPDKPGMEPLRIPEAPQPADTPELRQAQIRSLAEDFKVSTLRGTVERELFREPVYRFEQPAVEKDGELFVWFEDGDPELLMLIETRSTPEGPRWHMGFGRFTPLPVTAKYKGAKAWSFAPAPDEPSLGGSGHSYISVHGVEMLHHLRLE